MLCSSCPAASSASSMLSQIMAFCVLLPSTLYTGKILTNYKALCELIFISFSSLSFHCAPCSGHLTSVQYLSS